MSPAAESTGVSAKAGAFDTASLFVADKAASAEAANTVATLAKKEGVEFFGAIKLNEALVQALNDNKNPATREAACAAISTICEQGAGQLLEPYIISSDANAPFSILLETFADKEKAVKDAAIAAVKAIVQVMNPWATAVILPAILEQVKTAGKWQVKTGCLEVLQQLITSAPNQVGQATQDLISILAGAVRDTKWDVRKAVKVTLECATKLVDNKDIEQLIPALIKSLLNPIEELPKTITLLSATTFISEVTAPAMSLIAPLLVRGLDHPSAAVKRKVCVIADNMSKLVDSEYTVRPFLPQLLPRLIKMGETMGDPEACLICNRAVATLRRIGRVPEGSDGTNLPPLKIAEGPHITTNLVALVKTNGGAIVEQVNPALAYAGVLAASLVNAHNFDQDTWQDELVPYMELALPGVNSLLAVGKLLQKKADEAERGHVKYPDEEEGEDLCNIEHFDLASSTRLLLYNANIRLKRGHHYGLCGRNGLDKSAFLSALGDAQLINSRSNLAVRTFYVQQDVDESMSILDSVLSDKRLQASEQEIRRNLQSVGLNVVLQSHSVGSLSAENKMRLGLARAVLSKADIILLDEPTNHLDVLNVDWVVNYLTSLTTCTSIIVSHDSDFLNRTITDVLYLNNFKLNRYPGGLHAFAREVPAVRGFLRLGDALSSSTSSTQSALAPSFANLSTTSAFSSPPSSRSSRSNVTSSPGFIPSTIRRDPVSSTLPPLPENPHTPSMLHAAIPSDPVYMHPFHLHYHGLSSSPLLQASTQTLPVRVVSGGHPVPAILDLPVTSRTLYDRWDGDIVPELLSILRDYATPCIVPHLVSILRPRGSLRADIALARKKAVPIVWIGVSVEMDEDWASQVVRAVQASVVKRCADPVHVEIFLTSHEPLSAFLQAEPFSSTVGEERARMQFGLGMDINPRGTGYTSAGGALIRLASVPGVFALTCQHAVGAFREDYKWPGDGKPARCIRHMEQTHMKEIVDGIEAKLKAESLGLKGLEEDMKVTAALAEGAPEDQTWVVRAATAVRDRDSSRQRVKEMKTLFGQVKKLAKADRTFGSVYAHPPRRASVPGLKGVKPDEERSQSVGFTEDWALIQLDDKAIVPSTAANLILLDTREQCLNFPRSGDRFNPAVVIKGLRSEVRVDHGKVAQVMMRGAMTGVSVGRLMPLMSVTRDLWDEGDVRDVREEWSWELGVLALEKEGKQGRFSRKGDSGASVVDEEGRIVGVLTGGTGFDLLSSPDISFVTPITFIFERMRKLGLEPRLL